jgi:hypothetical protein
MAEAAVRLAKAGLEQNEAKYQKTFIHSPINAVILRRPCGFASREKSWNTFPDDTIFYAFGERSPLSPVPAGTILAAMAQRD